MSIVSCLLALFGIYLLVHFLFLFCLASEYFDFGFTCVCLCVRLVVLVEGVRGPWGLGGGGRKGRPLA